jgi:hypothetical protein
MDLINPGGGSGSSGVSEVDLYAYINASSGTPTIVKASSNLTSITDTAVGQYTLNFDAMASANYAWAGSVNSTTGGAVMFVIFEVDTRSTTALPVRVTSNSSTAQDTEFSVIITGA